MKKTVSFYNNRNEKLSGILFYPNKKKKYPGLIFCHGFTSSKFTKTKMAEDISKKGYVVLIFDASGCGESEGKFEEHTITKYVSEVGSAFDFLKSQPFVDKNRIAVAGHSLGGLVTVVFASETRINLAIPVDAPSNLPNKMGPESSFDMKDVLSEWKKAGYRTYDVRVNENRVPKKISYNFLIDAKKYDLSEIVKKLRCPVVIIQGDSDKCVLPENAKIMFSAANEPKELIFVKSVNHRYAGKDEKILEDLIIEKMKKYL